MFKRLKTLILGHHLVMKEKSNSQYNKELKDELEALKREIRTAKKD